MCQLYHRSLQYRSQASTLNTGSWVPKQPGWMGPLQGLLLQASGQSNWGPTLGEPMETNEPSCSRWSQPWRSCTGHLTTPWAHGSPSCLEVMQTWHVNWLIDWFWNSMVAGMGDRRTWAILDGLWRQFVQTVMVSNMGHLCLMYLCAPWLTDAPNYALCQSQHALDKASEDKTFIKERSFWSSDESLFCSLFRIFVLKPVLLFISANGRNSGRKHKAVSSCRVFALMNLNNISCKLLTSYRL